MSLVRWDAARGINEMQRSLNLLLSGTGTDESRILGFPVDVYETPTEVIVRADLPGVASEDIHIQCHDGQILIRTARSAKSPEGSTWLMHQTPEGDLVRSFTLGVPVDLDDVHATYEAGVLELNLPKAANAQPREIPVQGRTSRPSGPEPVGTPAPASKAPIAEPVAV